MLEPKRRDCQDFTNWLCPENEVELFLTQLHYRSLAEEKKNNEESRQKMILGTSDELLQSSQSIDLEKNKSEPNENTVCQIRHSSGQPEKCSVKCDGDDLTITQQFIGVMTLSIREHQILQHRETSLRVIGRGNSRSYVIEFADENMMNAIYNYCLDRQGYKNDLMEQYRPS